MERESGLGERDRERKEGDCNGEEVVSTSQLPSHSPLRIKLYTLYFIPPPLQYIRKKKKIKKTVYYVVHDTNANKLAKLGDALAKLRLTD